MTNVQLLTEAAMHEIEMLKKHATDKEKNRLTMEQFDPTHVTRCIYGMMTGDCASVRARELMDLSCIKMIRGDSYFCDRKTAKDIEVGIKYDTNDIWEDWENGKGVNRSYRYLSALECYIVMYLCDVPKIIDYLKSDIDQLNLQLLK